MCGRKCLPKNFYRRHFIPDTSNRDFPRQLLKSLKRLPSILELFLLILLGFVPASFLVPFWGSSASLYVGPPLSGRPCLYLWLFFYSPSSTYTVSVNPKSRIFSFSIARVCLHIFETDD